MDQSKNAIKAASETAKISLPDANIVYSNLYISNLDEKFDFIFTCNTLDVVPDEITISMLEQLKNKLNKEGMILICLNPIFSNEELTNLLKMNIKGHYAYKDGVLRANLKSIEEWVSLFSNYFSIVEYGEFYISINDTYKRRYYLMKNK